MLFPRVFPVTRAKNNADAGLKTLAGFGHACIDKVLEFSKIYSNL